MLHEGVQLDQRARIQQPLEPLARQALAALALPLHRAVVAGVQRQLAQPLGVRDLLGRGVRDRFVRLH